MDNTYYIIRDLTSLGYWDSYTQRFSGIVFAYKMSINTELAFDNEFLQARTHSKNGIELVKMYV